MLRVTPAGAHAGYDPVEFDKAEVEADRLYYGDLVKGAVPLADLFDQFIASRQELRRSPRTIGDYQRDFKRVKPELGPEAREGRDPG